jgi:hypothetical protein
MSSRHQPDFGADSPASLVYHRYRVRLEEELGARWWVEVPRALGPNDARNQAIQTAVERGFFDVTALEIRRAA